MKLYAIPPLLQQKLIWVPTRLILTIFGHLKIRGLNNLEGIKGNVIFIMNHSSEIDPFIVPSSLPFFSKFSPMFYATREITFYNEHGWRKHLFHDWFIKSWGGYKVISGTGNYEKSLVDHVAIIRDGYSFCIFPEGGITPNGMIRPAHGGVAYLVEIGQCCVVPVSVSGTYRSYFKKFFSGRKHIKVNFGKPIYHQDLVDVRTKTINEGGNVYKAESQFMMDKIKEGMIV